jgi:hypothetical protein
MTAGFRCRIRERANKQSQAALWQLIVRGARLPRARHDTVRRPGAAGQRFVNDGWRGADVKNGLLRPCLPGGPGAGIGLPTRPPGNAAVQPARLLGCAGRVCFAAARWPGSTPLPFALVSLPRSATSD